LAKRTIPTNSSQAADTTASRKEGIIKDGQSHKAKSNPFGGATAADTASRLEALEIRAKEKKEHAQHPHPQQKNEEDQEQGTGQEQVVTEHVQTEKTDMTNDVVDDAAGVSHGNKETEKRERRDRNPRQKEPRVINSRAAFLGEATAVSSGTSGRNREVSQFHGLCAFTIGWRAGKHVFCTCHCYFIVFISHLVIIPKSF
jgi:hypothetical protein